MGIRFTFRQPKINEVIKSLVTSHMKTSNMADSMFKREIIKRVQELEEREDKPDIANQLRKPEPVLVDR